MKLKKNPPPKRLPMPPRQPTEDEIEYIWIMYCAKIPRSKIYKLTGFDSPIVSRILEMKQEEYRLKMDTHERMMDGKKHKFSIETEQRS